MEDPIKAYSSDSTIAKIILLYVFDKMEIPMTESTILNLCCTKNTWINYMTCKSIMMDLIETNFIRPLSNQQPNQEPFYIITTDGRACLNYFFVKVPSSLREQIAEYISMHRLNFRKMQEFFGDYYKNEDGSYTVVLKILEPTGIMLDLKLKVQDRSEAASIYKKWEEKASTVYGFLQDVLND